MDYAQEHERLQRMQEETVQYWKPTSGKYHIEFLEEPTDTQYIEEGKKPVEQKQFVIKTNGLTLKWNVAVSFGVKSTWYQLVKLAKDNGNAFMGLKTTVHVSQYMAGGKTSKSYTFV